MPGSGQPGKSPVPLERDGAFVGGASHPVRCAHRTFRNRELDPIGSPDKKTPQRWGFLSRGASQNRTGDTRIFSNAKYIINKTIMIVFNTLTLCPLASFYIYLHPFIQKMVTYWSHGNIDTYNIY